MSKISVFLRNPVSVREHGAWAILFVPMLTAIFNISRFSPSVILFCCTIFFLFMAYYPFEIILTSRKNGLVSPKVKNAKFWFSLYIALSIMFAVWTLIISGVFGIFYFGFAALILFTASLMMLKKTKLSFLREALGITALCLSAPAIIYFTEGRITHSAIILYFSNVLFFISASFFVHLKLAEKSNSKETNSENGYKKAYLYNLIYSLLLLSLLSALAITRHISFTAAAAFAPMILHCLIFAKIKNPAESFKKTGFLFLAYSVFFTLLLSLYPILR